VEVAEVGRRVTGESIDRRDVRREPLRAALKPYRAPRLERHGRLIDLTQFGGSQVVDSGGNLGQQF
jgi:hypothetical protein